MSFEFDKDGTAPQRELLRALGEMFQSPYPCQVRELAKVGYNGSNFEAAEGSFQDLRCVSLPRLTQGLRLIVAVGTATINRNPWTQRQ